jgi:hypothetical protein
MMQNEEYQIVLPQGDILVKYPKLSKTWKRAKVIYNTSNSFMAFLIDEGITETFNTKNDAILKDLRSNYLSFKPAAKLCRLKTIDTHDAFKSWSLETTNCFKKLTINSQRTFYLNSSILEKELINNMNNELEEVYSVEVCDFGCPKVPQVVTLAQK